MNQKKQKILGVIPARIGSTRVPRKMLLDIVGKTLIERSFENAKKISLLDALVIATDSDEIREKAESFGAKVIMTSKKHRNGTERTVEAVEKFTDFEPDIVLTIWGDEPLTPPEGVDRCIQLLLDDSETSISGIAGKVPPEQSVDLDSVVKLVFGPDGRVLYISRSPIPYHYNKDETPEYYHILGALAWRKEMLFKYISMSPSKLERVEGIEQMRILEAGYKMRVVWGEYPSIGVNTPPELEKVREIYKKKEM